MTKREAFRQTQQENTLLALGFTRDEAEQLRRISMTLHRWFELECGDSNSYGSWAIERDEDTDVPYMVRHHYAHGNGKDSVSKYKIADRENGARKRLAAILAAREQRVAANLLPAPLKVTTYIQTDPRGASLYLLRPGDIPDGGTADAYYNRGICIY